MKCTEFHFLILTNFIDGNETINFKGKSTSIGTQILHFIFGEFLKVRGCTTIVRRSDPGISKSLSRPNGNPLKSRVELMTTLQSRVELMTTWEIRTSDNPRNSY